MARAAEGGQGLLQGVTELTRGLEMISRRVSRSIDRAVRRLETLGENREETQVKNRVEPTLGEPAPAAAPVHSNALPNALLAVDGLTLEAELAALEAIKNTARSPKNREASQQLNALAREIVELNRGMAAAVKDKLDAVTDNNLPTGRREPVMAAALPGKVISFTEAARALSRRKDQRRQA